MSTNAIEVEHLWKRFRIYQERNQYLKSALLQGRRARYEDFWAVNDVSLEIPHGSTFGIIGSNGSGKSTLLKCLAGILSPDKGELKINGRIAALLELGAGFHPDLSGRENVYLNGAILGMTNKEINSKLDEIVDFAGLGQFLDSPVKNYSSGMVVRLGFAVAINIDPEVLIIDEVLAVGDQSFQQRCYERIESIRHEGRTIILVSHGLNQITQLCDTVGWLEKGKLKALGPAIEVVSDYTGVSYKARTKLENEIGERWGSGEAEILRVSISDLDGKSEGPFISGNPMKVLVETEAFTPLDEIVVGLRITDLHGNPIWGSNTRRQGFNIPRQFGRRDYLFEIPELPLLEGTYDLTVAISDSSEVHAYDHWDRKIRFDVHQSKTFDEGIVKIHGNWSFV